MKIIVNKKPFLELIQNAINYIIARKTTIPITEGILLRVPSEDKIELCSTDLEVFLQQSMSAETEKETVGQSWVIDAKFFANLLPKLESEIVMMEFLKSTVKIIVGKNSYISPWQEANVFPVPPNLIPEQTLAIEYDTAVFKNYINKCIPFTTNDETRPVLAGIHYSQKDGFVNIEAADMFKMIHAKDTTDSNVEIDVVIPNKFSGTYTKIYSGEETVLKIDSKYIRLYGDGFMLHCRKIEFNFPNTASVYNQSIPYKLIVKKDTIVNAMKRMMVVNTMSKVVIFEIGKEKLVVKSSNEAVGMSGEEVFEDFKCDGDEARIGVNPDYMIACLNAFRSENVIINYLSKDKPLIMRDDKGAVETLVMPLAI